MRDWRRSIGVDPNEHGRRITRHEEIQRGVKSNNVSVHVAGWQSSSGDCRHGRYGDNVDCSVSASAMVTHMQELSDETVRELIARMREIGLNELSLNDSLDAAEFVIPALCEGWIVEVRSTPDGKLKVRLHDESVDRKTFE